MSQFSSAKSRNQRPLWRVLWLFNEP